MFFVHLKFLCTMQTKNISKKQIINFTIISFLITFLFWDSSIMPFNLHLLFTPLRLYTTAIHEAWHAIMALITGGTILEIKLNLDGSGSVTHAGGISILTTPAGYIGTSLTGALLILSSSKEKTAKLLLWSICSIVMLLGLFNLGSIFGIAFISAILLSIGIIYATIKTGFSSHIAIFLGTVLAINSIQDIKIIVFQSTYKSDAGILARSIGLEFLAIPIALIFSGISMYIWWKSIQYIMKKP